MLKISYSNFELEAGTDEAGRGCLSGPVVAAAVILDKDFTHPFLNDSKQLTKKQREQIFNKFGGKCAYCGCELPIRWHADHIEPIYREGKNPRVLQYQPISGGFI